MSGKLSNPRMFDPSMIKGKSTPQLFQVIDRPYMFPRKYVSAALKELFARLKHPETRNPLPKLVPEKHINFAFLLGTPLAGGFLMALNYLRIGKIKKATLSLILSLCGSLLVLFLMISQIISLTTPIELILIPSSAAIIGALIASSCQGRLLDLQYELGSTQTSLFLPILSIVFSLFFLFGIWWLFI